MTGRYPDLLSMWQYLHLLSFTGLPPELSSSVVSDARLCALLGPCPVMDLERNRRHEAIVSSYSDTVDLWKGRMATGIFGQWCVIGRRLNES